MSYIYETSTLYDSDRDIVYRSQSYFVQGDILEERLLFIDKRDLVMHRQTLFEIVSYECLGSWERWGEVMSSNRLLHPFDICDGLFITVPPKEV